VQTLLDLSEVPIIDNHVHGLDVERLLASDSNGLEARLTILGQAYLTANPDQRDPHAWPKIEGFVTGNLYSIISRRWMAEYFQCENTSSEVLSARDATMRADPAAYTRALLQDAGVSELVADEGFTYMPIGATDLEGTVGIPVHRVARIESFIDELISNDSCASLQEFADALEARLDGAAADGKTIALKSIIAYRTGLDVEDPSLDQAAVAFAAWKASAWRESRTHSKVVRDYLLHRAMAVVERHDIALHIHCGDGDVDVVFEHSRPQDLFRFLKKYQRQPIILMHAGHPWSEEAAYLASIMPHVYVDLSVLIPWASTEIERYLGKFLGMVPSGKLLYSSDQVYEPELFWIPAKLARVGLQRALTTLVEGRFLEVSEALDIARGILGDNCLRVHALPTR
jgi:hypothetical protein